VCRYLGGAETQDAKAEHHVHQTGCPEVEEEQLLFLLQHAGKPPGADTYDEE
jgi:hypothetical protein